VSIWRIFLSEMLEPLIRLFAWISAAFGRNRIAIEMRARGALVGGFARRLRIGRGVQWIGDPKRVELGHDVCIYGNTYLDFGGKFGKLAIGPRSHIDQNCVLYAQGGLTIGADCAIASGVIFYTQTNHDSQCDGTPVSKQPTRYSAVTIGEGAWLGCGARILPGVAVGHGAHIGAGSVVTKDVPSMVVSYGVPARTMKHRQVQRVESV
jgi:acetyltransferase-like isoleucine patch superfamily enzyme